MFLRGALLVGLLSLFGPVPNKTLLDGSAQPCADIKETTSGVPGVRVYAFNAAKIPAIRTPCALRSGNTIDSSPR